MSIGNVDGFENYRRERERRRRLNDDSSRPVAPGALRELLEVEAKEERNRVLNRDVHEFFETATRKAASIVQQFSATAKVESEGKLGQEMQQFLLESLERMQRLLVSVAADPKSRELAEQQMEPSMRNIVGALLDDFRNEGTAGGNKHLGEDPQAADLEAVRREFQARSGPKAANDEDVSVVPVGSMLDRQSQPGATSDPAPSPLAAGAKDRPLAAELLDQRQQDKKRKAKKTKKAPAGPTSGPPLGVAQKHDLDRFLAALDSLVQQGKMTQEEAKLAWEARLGPGGNPPQ